MMQKLFKPVGEETKAIIRSFHEQHQYNFLVPSKFVSVEAAQVGLLLNRLLSQEGDDYQTTFCNSRYEAVQAAIKLVRHNDYLLRQKKKKNNGREDGSRSPVYHYSREPQWLSTLFNPLGGDSSLALVPNVYFFHALSTLLDAVAEESPLAVVLSPSDMQDLYEAMSALKHRRNTLLVVDVSALMLSDLDRMPASLRADADIYVLGEACSGHEIPFGAVLAREAVRRPWSGMDGCLSHTSTYGGGRIVLARVCRELLTLASCSGADTKHELEAIESSKKSMTDAFARFVNPGLLKLNAIMKLDCQPVYAHGGQLTLHYRGRVLDVYDCVLGAGASTRGHSPDDVLTNVVDRHNPDTDYWSELKTTLTAMTGYPHMFPAVSGATAVENALLLAVSANPTRRRIVVFNHNYAGQTLVSLLGSALEEEQNKFKPLYADVLYLDLKSPSLMTDLEAVLNSGEVALVWLEAVQGSSGVAVPAEVLALIQSCRETGQYLVGIDEILLSFHRSRGVFHFSGLGIEADLVTASKALSDGVMPMGVTFANERVYRESKRLNPELTASLEQLYLNQFAAHVALNVLNGLKACTGMEKSREILKDGFKKIAEDSEAVQSISGDGFLYNINYSKKGKCQRLFGALGEGLFPLFMYQKLLLEGKVYVYIDRVVFPVTLSERDAKTIVERMHAVLTNEKRQRRQFIAFVWKMAMTAMFKSDRTA